jgi:tetratricopeptide (TPR) repeat protein
MNPVTSLPSALASITLSVSLALGSTVAYAAPPDTGEGEAPTAEAKDQAESLSERAIGEFSAKNYAGAVELFKQAYEVDPQPNYLFNIGRVYEEAGEFEDAVEYYAKFVKQPGVDLDSREVALERLRVLRGVLEATRDATKGTADDGKDEPTDKDVIVPVEPPTQPPVDTDVERKRKIMRGVGFGFAGAGAGALIGAAVVGVLARSDGDKAFDRDEAGTLGARQDFLSGAQTKALTADILYGVGGALLLTGVILIAVGYSKPKARRVALQPSFGPERLATSGRSGWAGGLDLRFSF